MSKHDAYYMAIAEAVAQRSKDESTKLGAVVVGNVGEVRSTGFNSFPIGIVDTLPERQVRPLKYKWFVHAEANAIYLAARIGTRLDGCTLYCRWLPCPHCAMAIIQAGIRRIVVSSFKVPARWTGDMQLSTQMLREAGVTIRLPGGRDLKYVELK